MNTSSYAENDSRTKALPLQVMPVQRALHTTATCDTAGVNPSFPIAAILSTLGPVALQAVKAFVCR